MSFGTKKVLLPFMFGDFPSSFLLFSPMRIQEVSCLYFPLSPLEKDEEDCTQRGVTLAYDDAQVASACMTHSLRTHKKASPFFSSLLLFPSWLASHSYLSLFCLLIERGGKGQIENEQSGLDEMELGLACLFLLRYFPLPPSTAELLLQPPTLNTGQ